MDRATKKTDQSYQTDTRALSPVIEKSAAAGIALLYVGGMFGLLYGGVIPLYETSAGEEVSERTLATAGAEIETAVPATSGDVNTTREIELPSSIANSEYTLMLSNDTLRLEHSDRALDREISIRFGPNVSTKESTWHSGQKLTIRVKGPTSNRTVWIGDER